jgi:hypothetical protein
MRAHAEKIKSSQTTITGVPIILVRALTIFSQVPGASLVLTLPRVSLCANDDETKTPREFSLEGLG